MQPFFQTNLVTLYCGDCREVLPTLEGVSAVVTDPPYGLEFMGKDWDEGVPGEEFWRLIAAVCRPGAHLLSFGGTRTWHRLACAIEAADWEIRDTLMWLYGQGFPKSLDVSKAIDKASGAERDVIAPPPYTRGHTDQTYADGRKVSYAYPCQPITAPATDAAKEWQGWGTALKPAWEPIILARKPLIGTVAANVLEYGTGAINIDESRIEGTPWQEHEATGLAKIKFFTAGEAAVIHKAPHIAGRFPANLLLDEETAEQIDEQAGVSVSRIGKPRKSQQPGEGWGMTKTGSEYSDSGGPSRFFYCAKPSRKDRGTGNTHPTVKPTKLMEYLLRLVVPPESTVLDPFAGSGTTLLAAQSLGIKAVGIEMNPDYCEIIKSRLSPEAIAA